MVCTSADVESTLESQEVVNARRSVELMGQSSSEEFKIVPDESTTKRIEDDIASTDVDHADDDESKLVKSTTSAGVRRNWSSASIASAYRMIRNGSVSSTARKRTGMEGTNEEKVPLGLSTDVRRNDDEDELDAGYDYGPPDGGWGWMVLLGTVIVNTLIPGLIKSFGVFFVELLTVFQTTPSSVAWIPALTFALYNLLGPVASVISMKYSCRFATILGGLSATLGLALSYFATSIEFMYFSYGVMGGIGAGMSYTPGVLIVGEYFNKRRGLANGICASGSALGSIILPPVLNFLLSEYGYRGALLILCGLIMNVCVGAALYQPVEWHLKKIPRSITNAGSPVEMNGSHQQSGDHGASPNAIQKSTNRTMATSTVMRRPQSNPRFLPGLSSAVEESSEVTDLEESCQVPDCGSSAPTVTFMVGGSACAPTPQYVAGLGMGSTSSSLAPVNLNLHRSPSVVSTISSSSFAYLSTIYHGSTPAAYQLNQIATGGHRDSLIGSQIINNRCCCDPNVKCACPVSTNKKLTAVNNNNDEGGVSAWKMIFDLSLMSNTVFLLITYTVVASGIGYTNLLIILPAYATSLGMEKSESSGLLSVIAGADLAGRIGGAWMSDLMSFPCKYLYMGGFLVSGVALMFMPHGTSFAGMASFCAVFGLASGIYIGLMAVLLVNHLGAEKLGSSFGLSLAINGVVMMSGPPIVAVILENIGKYEPVIFILGLIILSGGLIFILEPVARGYEERKILKAKLGSPVSV